VDIVKTKRAWLGVALIATLLIFSVLTLVAWDFVRGVIVVPLTYLLWLGGLILNSIPQELYLIGLIIVAGIIALNTLNKLQRKPASSRFTTTGTGDASRYRLWLRLCAAAPASEYARLELARETRKLVVSVLAYQDGLTQPAVEQKIVSGALPVPDTVGRLFRERDLMSTPQPAPRFWQRLLRKADRQPDPLLDQSLEEIVQFIEDRLEIVHDGNPLSVPD
jgi:hypothetical protein